MNTTIKKLRNLKHAFLMICMAFAASTTLQAQSLVNNGDFSSGISTNWSHLNTNGYATYTDVSGALQAVITNDPSHWYTTGIRNSKQNTVNLGDLVRVKFSAQTSNVGTQVRLAIHSASEGGAGNYLEVDLTADPDFQDYTFFIENTDATATDYKFRLQFLDAGTFKIDDIEVDIWHTSSNLALTGTASAESLAAGTADEINDGITTEYSGCRGSSGASRWFNIEWGASQGINKVIVYAVDNASHALTDYTLQYWDGAAYQDIVDVSGVTSYPVTSTFTTINTTRFRLLATGGQYRVDEIELYHEATLATEADAVQEDSFLVYSKPNSIVVSATETIEQLQIYSLVGTLVYETKNSSEAGNLEIATDTLAKGIYIVRINSQYTQKIIVQ